ncbi:hypothetical protein OOZ15_17530 [Galbibacter sp. EGI 63066]|nr:hypothetical protein [Galbibacter sp. EGI 63066]MCX2681759.1 hypothetical protein [Galbibacter sp. EGI 63066]
MKSLRAYSMVIENASFIDMGYRKKGGFIGEGNKDTFPHPRPYLC